MSGIQTLPSDVVESDCTNVYHIQSQLRITTPGTAWRRWFYFTLVAISSTLGGLLMLDILRPQGLTLLELILLLLFISTFSWVVSAFWSAAIGFTLQLFQLDPNTLKRQSAKADLDAPLRYKTAIVMPVYNEDTARIIAGFETNIRAIQDSGHSAQFDFYMLSDTQKPELIAAELNAWNQLQQRLGSFSRQVFYRRREKNIARKVGNLADFCQRWGSQYEHMIVLDADSIMSSECMLTLAHMMEANPQAGLMQTVPIPVRQETLFGRFIQYSAALYSPLIAAGFAFWQTDNANYWGHNAIIRVRAFTHSCGLPTLPGKPPFGGDILSHDFVEAALLYRNGWKVYLLADLPGSFEEVPSNIIDYATRDRRWVQGNLQHLGLLKTPGLSNISRVHFINGALAYISSLSWLVMLGLSTLDAILRAINSNIFFAEMYQLFPDWPIAKTDLIYGLLYLTISILVLPKIMGIIIAFIHHKERFGGAAVLTQGVILEFAMAVLIAPLMMLFHAYFVISVLTGHSVSWNSQAREGRMVPWIEAIRRTWIMSLSALLWGGIVYAFSESFFWWLSPVVVGMFCAGLFIRYTSSIPLGVGARQGGIFIVPTEAIDEPVLAILREKLMQFPAIQGNEEIPDLPEEHWVPMPTQRFS